MESLGTVAPNLWQE